MGVVAVAVQYLNMKKPKNILIFIFLALSVISIAYLILSSRGKSPILPPAAFSTPAIPDIIKNKPLIQIDVDSANLNLPAKLPLIRQTAPQALESTIIKNIALNLEFKEDPSSANDAKMGLVYFYNNPKNFLIVYPKIRKIKYGPSTSSQTKIDGTINKQLTDNSFVALATDFLVKKIGLPEDSIKLSGFVYLKTETGLELFKETDRSSAQIFQLNFSSSITPYPILTLNPQQAASYVQFLIDGSVLNAEVIFPGQFSLSENEYQLKKYDEAVNSVNQAIIVSLNDSNINLPDLKDGSIKNIVIQKINVAYLLDKPLSETLLPVFLFEGTAMVEGFETPLHISLYLPAFSENP